MTQFMSRYARLISHRLEGITNDYPWGSLGGPVGWSRRAVFEALRQREIGVNVHYLTEAERDKVASALRETLR